MFLLWSLQAAADLAPPPELLRPCTVEAWCDATEEGQTCTESPSDAFACQALLDQGYDRRCSGQTDADGSWPVVYCRTRTEHSQPAEQPQDTPADAPGTVIPPGPRRCSAVSGGGGLAMFLALLGAMRRRSADV